MRQRGNIIAFYTHHDWPSNHYLRDFMLKDVVFSSAEQAIMFCKARLFGDLDAGEEIMTTEVCQEQKRIGRRVQGFDDKIWKEKIPGYYLQILLAKYRCNPDLRSQLIATGDAILVEASERDKYWGAGLSEHDDRIFDPSQWLGENLCGYVHMRARDILQNDRY